MQWIFDSSVALAWCFEDERTAKSDALLGRAADEPSVVPQILPLEIVNVLSLATSKRRVSDAQRNQFLRMLGALPVTIDVRTLPETFKDVLFVAEKYALTSYDAAYLELAIRLDAPLATLDAKLHRAAKLAGVAVA